MATIVAACVLLAHANAAAPKPSLRGMLQLVAARVQEFEQTFAQVIADEDYEQVQELDQTSNRRGMRSEVLSLWIPDARRWMWARNVTAVDGVQVESATRLDEALADPSPDLLNRLTKIRDEGARFNIGGVSRNFNDPTFTLMFFAAEVQPRFKFQLDGTDTVDGVNAVRIKFWEQRRPTLVRDGMKDAPASGFVWVGPADGTVLKTQLTLTLITGSELRRMFSNASQELETRAQIEVDYQRDAGIQSWVPIRMREQYRRIFSPLDLSRVLERVTCTATYSNFRRFQASARLVPDP